MGNNYDKLIGQNRDRDPNALGMGRGRRSSTRPGMNKKGCKLGGTGYGKGGGQGNGKGRMG